MIYTAPEEHIIYTAPEKHIIYTAPEKHIIYTAPEKHIIYTASEEQIVSDNLCTSIALAVRHCVYIYIPTQRYPTHTSEHDLSTYLVIISVRLYRSRIPCFTLPKCGKLSSTCQL